MSGINWFRGLGHCWRAKWFLIRIIVGFTVLSPIIAVNLIVIALVKSAEALRECAYFVDDTWDFLLDHGPIDWLGKRVARFVGNPPQVNNGEI